MIDDDPRCPDAEDVVVWTAGPDGGGDLVATAVVRLRAEDVAALTTEADEPQQAAPRRPALRLVRDAAP